MPDTMSGPRVLVLYTSEHSATREIAERIAVRLRHNRVDARARSLTVTSAKDLFARDAFVIGSAVYYRSWLRSAQLFVERHCTTLAQRPVWLFSSGLLGRASTTPNERDVPQEAETTPVHRLTSLVAPREHHVFSSSLHPETLGSAPQAGRTGSAGRDLLAAGDGRDWAEMDSWADHIAQELATLRTTGTPAASDSMRI